MDYKEFFIKHWEKEGPATRKVISRIPEDRSDYKPEPKSRNAREIAWLIVREEASLVDGLEKGAFDWVEVPCPAKVSQIVAEYEKQHDSLTKRLKAIPASKWEAKLPFMMDGQEVMRENGYDMAWGFLLDQIHHRGQLSTYLRPMGAKVPAIYGPSADEQS
ncbi:MAG TPA: DinB family protein [Candidatus Acidoferrales bacterium]